MMFPRRFFHRTTVNVPVETVWDLFTNHERMEEYTGTPCEIIKPGKGERNGLGCVRTVGVPEHGMPLVPEVVNFWEPNRVFGYHVLSGAPISHHQGLVFMRSLGPRLTEYVYNMRLMALPSTLEAMPDFYAVLDRSFRQFMKNAEAECERRGSEDGLFRPPSQPVALSEQGGQLVE